MRKAGLQAQSPREISLAVNNQSREKKEKRFQSIRERDMVANSPVTNAVIGHQFI